jgi:hypothetical protein
MRWLQAAMDYGLRWPAGFRREWREMVGDPLTTVIHVELAIAAVLIEEADQLLEGSGAG